jgi:hypothetical protein
MIVNCDNQKNNRKSIKKPCGKCGCALKAKPTRLGIFKSLVGKALNRILNLFKINA